MRKIIIPKYPTAEPSAAQIERTILIGRERDTQNNGRQLRGAMRSVQRARGGHLSGGREIRGNSAIISKSDPRPRESLRVISIRLASIMAGVDKKMGCV